MSSESHDGGHSITADITYSFFKSSTALFIVNAMVALGTSEVMQRLKSRNHS